MSIDLEKYKKNKELKLQLELYEFYKNNLLKNDIFRAAVLVGSFAKGSADRLSDLDLIVFVTDYNGRSAFKIIDEMNLFKEVYSYTAEHQGKYFFKKSIFENFVSSEIHIAEKTSGFKLKNPYISLFDHDNFLPKITEEGEPPKQEDFPALSSGGDEMGWALFDLLKWTIRGDKELCKLHFLKIADELKKT